MLRHLRNNSDLQRSALRNADKKGFEMKKKIAFVLAAVLALTAFSGCSKSLPGTNQGGNHGGSNSGKNQVVVYNYGDYIEPGLIEQFEEETGIKVVYDEFQTNEEMYPKVESGAVVYDVICAGEYTIEKMLANDMLQEINYDNIPNFKNIGAQYLKMCETYDPGNKFSVPYTFGTLGIMYNTSMVSTEIDSWDDIWDATYSDNILMIKSLRDALAVGLLRNGNSINSTDDAELAAARDLLIEQKPLVQGYFVDQSRDKMIGNEAALAVVYSGEYMEAKAENPDIAYIVPEEGSNYWTDAWVIPKNAANKENAEKWIDFLCRAEVAATNFDYLWYPTPNVAAQELIEEEYINDTAIFPDQEILDRCEILLYLGTEMEQKYGDYWTEVLSH